MAKGSESFAWKLFPGAARRCHLCGREPLRIKDVAEHRSYVGEEVRFTCRTCFDEKVARSIEETRRALGLPPTRT